MSLAKPACVCKSSCKSSGHGSDRVDTTEVWDPRPIQLCASGLCGKQLRRGADRVLFRGIRAESDWTNRGKAAGFSDWISPRGRVWVKNSRPCRDLRFNLSYIQSEPCEQNRLVLVSSPPMFVMGFSLLGLSEEPVRPIHSTTGLAPRCGFLSAILPVRPRAP